MESRHTGWIRAGSSGALGLALLLCGTTAARADVATDIGQELVAYYVVSKDEVVETWCPQSSVVHDRATCRFSGRRLPAWGFFFTLSKSFGAGVPAAERLVVDLGVRVSRIDAQLITLLSASPDPARPDLLAAIAKVESQLTTTTALVATYKDQIAIVEAELAQGDDPDLRLQLVVLTTKLNDTTRTRETQAEALRVLRHDYVAANAALIDPSTFAGLTEQRADVVGQIDAARRVLDNALDEEIARERVVKKLLDQTFTWEFLDGETAFPRERPVGGAFPQVFAEIQRTSVYAGSHFIPSVGGFQIAVTRQGELKQFDCSWEPRAPAAQFCHDTRVEGPGFAEDLGGRHFDVDRFEASHGALKPLANGRLAGLWTIKPICDHPVALDFFYYGCTVEYEPLP